MGRVQLAHNDATTSQYVLPSRIIEFPLNVVLQRKRVERTRSNQTPPHPTSASSPDCSPTHRTLPSKI